jgi:DNA repair protein RecO (recombination protein O)
MLECELVEAYAARFLDDAERLAALSAAAALVLASLPEREPHGDIFASFSALLGALDSSRWPEAYVLWESGLLAALGFGLDLTCCAVTGTSEDLTHVSPRTGRAVSRAAAIPYRDKLLPLPSFLWREAAASPADISAGLALTEHFLVHHLLAPHGRGLPEARVRFAERMRRPTAAGILSR